MGLSIKMRSDMPMRLQFENKLHDLQNDILKMGQMVEKQLQLALKTLETMDKGLAHEVIHGDSAVNAQRFLIEEKCVELIATQQPAARDLRAIIAVMNMIVDLEQMGDQAKEIVRCVLQLPENPKGSQPTELKQMGEMVSVMLNQVLAAYHEKSTILAEVIAKQNRDVRDLYTRLFSHIIENMAETKKRKRVLEAYEILRAAQKLERIGDLATNIAERVIYVATGKMQEINVEPDERMN
jgi:phosphate transport system protein